MKTKILCALIAVATSFGLFMGCSDSDGNNVTGSDDSLVTVPPNTAELKGESHDFKVSSCKSHLAKWFDGTGEESIDFYINEDGSATVNIESGMGCDGFYSMLYETKNDTLFAKDFIQCCTKLRMILCLQNRITRMKLKNLIRLLEILWWWNMDIIWLNAFALLTSNCISRQNLLARNMSILKAIAARLFTRRKSNLIVVHEKRWPTSHLFCVILIVSITPSCFLRSYSLYS